MPKFPEKTDEMYDQAIKFLCHNEQFKIESFDEKNQYCLKTDFQNNNSPRSHALIHTLLFPVPREINSHE